jgi:DNA modification methylase
VIHHGDCVEVMATMPDASVDAVVTDPPYGLGFMGKSWDTFGGPLGVGHGLHRKGGREVGGAMKAGDSYDRSLKGQRGYQAWCEAWARECLRVAKPGAYLLSSGGTRTVHRLAAGIEDAGWIIRDCLVWAYASGFPKGKANLKPAWEPIVMARKPGPLRMLNVDACRIGTDEDTARTRYPVADDAPAGMGKGLSMGGTGSPFGRWPANLILTDPIFDGDMPGVVGGGEVKAGVAVGGLSNATSIYGSPLAKHDAPDVGYGDSGTYSRFFLIAKASRSDREPVAGGNGGRVVSVWGGDEDDLTPGKKSTVPRQNVHPTVKPTELMRHLVRLVTPTGGTVLDPFLGSGTTGVACEMEGFPWIGIEKEAEYVAIAEARLLEIPRGLGLETTA